MCPFYIGYVELFVLSFLVLKTTCSADQCRHLEFRAEQTFQGKRLVNHVIRVDDFMMTDFCDALCYMEHNCASYNLMRRSEPEGHRCELNNSTHEGNENDLEENPDYVYRGTKSACVNNPCKNNATCQTGFTDKGYRCLCTAGFEGQDCQNDIDECDLGKDNCDDNAVCINTEGSYECNCNPGYFEDGPFCKTSPCKDLFDRNLSEGNKAYGVTLESDVLSVYCHMTDDLGACGGGGWTLVMKMDGNEQTFYYDSDLWIDNEAFNLVGGETGFDTQETKLPTYWNTPFSRICLGMKVEEQFNFIVINKQANSLYSLISDGQYRTTSLGRDTWKMLIGSQASLQLKCNREGFNAVGGRTGSKARIGFVANNENFCYSADSRIGFGTGGDHDNNNTCGNEAKHNTDNGDIHLKAMGYIFVQ